MISKVIENTLNQRIIMAEPQEKKYKPFFKYSILHEWFDNCESDNNVSMLDIEKKVMSEYFKDNLKPNIDSLWVDIDFEEYINSRIAFFQWQLEANQEDENSENKHDQDIEETTTRLQNQSQNSFNE